MSRSPWSVFEGLMRGTQTGGNDEISTMRNFDALRNTLGESRIEEIFTAILLVFGPPPYTSRRVGGFGPLSSVTLAPSGGRLVEFRGVLQTASGIAFSLHDSLPWYKEYYRWFEKQKSEKSR